MGGLRVKKGGKKKIDTRCWWRTVKEKKRALGKCKIGAGFQRVG
jgi:hypothetical protein